MKKTILFAAALMLVPGMASAFPVAVGAVGVGLLGVMAFPVALLVAGAAWVAKRRGEGLVPLMTLLVAVSACLFLFRDYGQDQAAKAALFTNADTAFLSPSIPFPFVEPAEQVKSPQAVTPSEFMDGIAAGHFKALKISTYPSLFTKSGQVAVDDFWRNKDVLVDAVNQLGGRVVLVDEYGGIAASIAGAAMRNFGLNVGFLQGGSAALSRFSWSAFDQGVDLGGSVVPVSDYRNWISQRPDAYVLGITTDLEFVKDGWVFGDRTLTLPDFVSNYHDIAGALRGRQVFVVGFETSDTGATPIVVELLAKAGIDVSYVMPTPDEILIKPAYYDAYPNDSRTVSIEDAKRYILHRQDVEFLDFSERPWAIGVAFLKERYHHFPMGEVAKGGLDWFINGLDPQKVYIGLAFDRRTAYHSLLAGELLSKKGVGWLGRFTLASSFSEPYLTVEDLNTEQEQLAYAVRDGLGGAGFLILGYGLPVAALIGLLAAFPAIAVRRKQPARAAAIITTLVLIIGCVIQARADYPQVEGAYSAFTATNAAGLILVAIALWRRSRPPIRSFSQYAAKLPPKAALLNVAAERGYTVAPGFVVAPEDYRTLAMAKLGAGRYIVRSAMVQEAVDHSSTAGVFESYACPVPTEIPGMVGKVFAGFTTAGVDGYALVQRYVDAEWYGVIQFQANEKSPLMVCEVGHAEAVTSGDAAAQLFQFPAWDAAKAPPLVRKAAMALADLSACGAHSIEFALSASGKLVVLQVNQSKSRACAEKRLMASAQITVVEVGAAHPDALSAAIVAALSPGQIFAYGNRRFCEVRPSWRLKMTLKADLRAMGFCTRKVQPKHLLAWVDRYSRNGQLGEGCRAEVHAVVAALQSAAETVGRMNRIASSMLATGKAGKWEWEPRLLPSSQVGALLQQGAGPEWTGVQVCPLAGFAVTAAQLDFSADELPATVLDADSPIGWVKDATSVLLAARLAAIKPAIDELIEDGRAKELMDALEAQSGDWDALTPMTPAHPFVQTPQTFASVVLGSATVDSCWRIPPAGIAGVIITPATDVAGEILLLDRCSMTYLPLLQRAKAVIARQGSITSHLMQHAAAMGLPVIIGGDIPHDLATGDRVVIKARGVVVRA